MTICSCCGIEPVSTSGRHHDDHRSLHCDKCRVTEHQAYAARRDTDHKAWWEAHHARTVADLQKRITELRSRLADPDAQVREANDRAESAYRTRDRTIRSLSYVEEIHHADGQDNCTCGRKQNACAEFKAVYVVRELITKWERDQKQRMITDQIHSLPRDHPIADPDEHRRWNGAETLDAEFARARSRSR